jgi:hypothetical protein
METHDLTLIYFAQTQNKQRKNIKKQISIATDEKERECLQIEERQMIQDITTPLSTVFNPGDTILMHHTFSGGIVRKHFQHQD